ncbi:MAG TPA: hypothetical protein VFT29_07855 [Gemmatimonadaceae bacterium]|nr:hypothetical protein [Gemmatimonadaceae bacterium]
MTSPLRPTARAAAFACVAVFSLVFSACSREAVAPHTLPVLKQVVANKAGLRRATSNSIKYRDRGLPPAMASAGAAAIEMRALVGKTGDALVEASTGSLDTGAGPGSIDKVQLKILRTDTTTLNFHSNGGYWAGAIQGVMKGDAIQLKASVSGISNGTDVLTVTGAVALRPDLEVTSVAAPKRVFTHNPVMLVAALREKNGDVGARANCVLSVDGAAVDQATGIWVDAGDVVSCMFMHTFDEPGDHSVRIAAASVSPTDWDDANNAVTRSIVVADPGTPILNGYLEFWEQHAHESYDAVRGGENPRHFIGSNELNFTQLIFNGETKDLAPGPFPRVETRLFRNDVVIHESTLTDIQVTHTDAGIYIADCGYYQSAGEGMQYCTAVPSPTNPNFFFNSVYLYVRLAGTVTYMAHDEFCQLYDDCDIWNHNSSLVWDPPTALGFQPGDALRVELEYVDVNGKAHIVNETVALVDAPDRANFVFNDCFPWGDGLGDACITSRSTGNAVLGFKEWGPEPPFHF